MADFDARALNWRFVVPDEPAGLLLLPADGETVAGATVVPASAHGLAETLARGPFPAVVAPDMGGWAVRTGFRTSELLERLGRQVVPGGWIFAGFANPWYVGRWLRRGSLRRRRAMAALRRAGLAGEAYLTFPSEQCPAYIVPASGRAELDYLLRRLFVPHTGEPTGFGTRVKRRLLMVMRAVALRAPHRARVAFCPGLAVVARRPG
ncbi:MAG: hypothetical protein ACJ77A_19345 [Actinomycetota bacterium]